MVTMWNVLLGAFHWGRTFFIAPKKLHKRGGKNVRIILVKAMNKIIKK